MPQLCARVAVREAPTTWSRQLSRSTSRMAVRAWRVFVDCRSPGYRSLFHIISLHGQSPRLFMALPCMGFSSSIMSLILHRTAHHHGHSWACHGGAIVPRQNPGRSCDFIGDRDLLTIFHGRSWECAMHGIFVVFHVTALHRHGLPWQCHGGAIDMSFHVTDCHHNAKKPFIMIVSSAVSGLYHPHEYPMVSPWTSHMAPPMTTPCPCHGRDSSPWQPQGCPMPVPQLAVP